MSELPQVFDTKGVFQDLDDTAIGQLPETLAATYLALADAAHTVAAKDSAERAAQERVTACIVDLRGAEEYLATNYKPITQFDLWKETFGRR